MLHLLALGVLVVATDPEPKEDLGPHGIEGRVGMSFFGGSMGGQGLSAMGIHFALEKRLDGDDLQLGLEVGYLGLHDPEQQVDWRGRMTRGAVVARFKFVESDYIPVMGAWIDVGVGAERITWQRGGVLHRPELMIGMSGSVGAVWGKKGDRSGRFGDFFQVRALISRGPGCAGMMCPAEIEMGVQGAVGFYFSE